MSDNPRDYEGQPGVSELEPETDENFLVDGRETRKLITMKTINALPERAVTRGQTVKICAIAGEIDGIAELVSPKDGQVFEVLVGDFEAVVYDDAGEVVTHAKAPMTFLPGGFHESAVLNWKKRQASDRPELLPAAAFWLEFYAEPAQNPRGYRYMSKNRLKYNPQTDRLARLRAEANQVAAIEAKRAAASIEHKPNGRNRGASA